MDWFLKLTPDIQFAVVVFSFLTISSVAASVAMVVMSRRPAQLSQPSEEKK